MDIRLEAYNGPLELLLNLIEKNEIDIYDIPIAEVADQYIEYIKELPPDMDSISGFLLMAAELLEIKSKMLLPKPQAEKDETDPREQLVNRLEEYRLFKSLAEFFKETERPGEYIFLKPPEKNEEWRGYTENTNLPELLSGLSPELLYGIFEDVLKRRELKTDKLRAGFNAIEKDVYSIEDKIRYIGGLLEHGKKIGFMGILDMCVSRAEQVVTFLALLELVRLKRVSMRQEKIFGDILLSGQD